MQYRCVIQTDEPPKECNEPISSYVSPHNESFHEDIALPGVDFALHYASSERNNTLAQGWMPSRYAYLKNSTLHLGSGVLYAVTQSSTEGNLTVIPYGSNEYLFDTDGKLQSIRDLYTKETRSTFGYDNVGRLVTITDEYGEVSTIERDANGTATAIVAPTGQRTLLSIDGNGDLVEIQYEDTSAYAFEYENHLMTVETEPDGNRFEHIYDANGHVIEVIDAEQGEWRFLDTADRLQIVRRVIRPEGDTVTYTDHLLESNATTLTSQTHLPSGDTITYIRALDDGNATVKSCGMQTVSLYKKNADGTLYRDPLSGKRVLASKEVDTPGGLSSLTTYDTRYDFDANGNLVSIDRTVDRNGARYRSVRDYAAHTLTNRSPENRVVTVRYDDRDQLPVKVRYADLAPITYRYDDKGRVIKQKQGRRVFLYRYDARGNLVEVYDKQKGTKTRYAYDLLGRVTQITYPDGSKERFEYDANGNLVARTVPTPATYTFDYNGVNKRTAETSPEQKTTTYAYDKQRRVTAVTKPSGKTIDYAYTGGRLASVTTPEGTTQYTYACRNNVSMITRDGESISYGYDGTLPTSIAQSGVLNQTVSYTYNNDFLPATVTYAGVTQPYAYDKDGLLTQSGALILTRDAQNGLTVKISDGTLMRRYDYNRFGEIKKAKDEVFAYRLKRAKGRIAYKRETLRIKVPKKRGGFRIKKHKRIERYVYDKRGRLVKVYRGKGKHRRLVERYAYDANGNRAEATVYGKTYVGRYTLDDNVIVYGDNTYRYDDDGYLVEKTEPQGSTTYTYNTLGALTDVTLPDGTQIRYLQDALNRRVAKEVNGTVVEKYLWEDLTTLLAVYDGYDRLVWRFEYADGRMPVAMRDANGAKYYLHYDQVGSLRAVSDTNGNVVKEIVYDTFGNILSDTNPSFKVPFGFAGGLYDPLTKLTHFGFREYDSFTGKWTAKDPIGFAGGDSNLYGYVLNDPVNLVDPEGEFPIALPIIIPWLEAAGWAGLGAGTGWAIWNAWNDNGGNVCYIHGDDPEGKTGKKRTWDKHSKKRAGQLYGDSRNSKRGNKNKKYRRPANPNKRR